MILKYQGQTEEKETVIEYINNGFLKKDGVFASHPLLLTYVTMKYPTYKRFHSDHLLFYKSTYEALLSGHDDNKKPYDRVFMSVDNADQFSKVFKEFCGITYKDGVLQLDSPSFEEYFNKLKSHKVFENPHKMNLTNFKHDVCSTACMMYEKEYDIFYIDPGFQEYLFAEYYRSAEIEDILEHFDQKTYRGDKSYVYNALTNISEVASADRGKVEEIKQKQRLSGFNSIFAVSSVEMAKAYYEEFRKQIKNDPTKDLKIAVIYSYSANEEEQDGILDEENPEDTSALDQTARDFLDGAINDYNMMFHTNYDTSSDKFQNYYKDVLLKRFMA